MKPSPEKSDFFEDFKTYEVLAIDLMSYNDQRKPIVEYLGNATGVTDRKVKYIAISYVIMGNELFKKSPEEILLKCFGKSGAYLSISKVHRRSCGSHQEDHKMK